MLLNAQDIAPDRAISSWVSKNETAHAAAFAIPAVGKKHVVFAESAASTAENV
jgi:hypothetical protein